MKTFRIAAKCGCVLKTENVILYAKNNHCIVVDFTRIHTLLRIKNKSNPTWVNFNSFPLIKFPLTWFFSTKGFKKVHSNFSYLSKRKPHKNQKCVTQSFSLSLLNIHITGSVHLTLMSTTIRAARESNPLFYSQQQDWSRVRYSFCYEDVLLPETTKNIQTDDVTLLPLVKKIMNEL